MKSIILFALLGLVSASVIEQPKGTRADNVIIGDMILTHEQYEIMYGKGKDPRSGNPDPLKLWPDRKLPYEFSSSISFSEKRKVRNVISKFNSEMKGCFKIVERSNERSYVSVVRDDGCSSWLGKIGGRQEISLASNCYNQGTIIHEFIHAIGFDHEQNRPDRDNYVKIMWGNIRGGRKNNNFEKANGWKMFGTEYDWKSVMHYRAYNGASSNGGPTMTSRRPELFTTNEMGSRGWMTETDRLEIKMMYGCVKVPGKVCDGTQSYDRECCSYEEPCGLNQGDCDEDYECKGNLVCGRNNCPWPFPSRADCCVNP